MHKTIEAYYKNGRIIYTDAMPKIKAARLLITIIEEKIRFFRAFTLQRHF